MNSFAYACILYDIECQNVNNYVPLTVTVFEHATYFQPVTLLQTLRVNNLLHAWRVSTLTYL